MQTYVMVALRFKLLAQQNYLSDRIRKCHLNFSIMSLYIKTVDVHSNKHMASHSHVKVKSVNSMVNFFSRQLYVITYNVQSLTLHVN